MATHGGLGPQPERYGADPRLEKILESLNRQRGTAYDTSIDSNVYASNMATARTLDAMWATNERAANQFIPSTMTTCLPRWERMMGIGPLPTDTDTDRRNRIDAVWGRFGRVVTRQVLVDQLQAILGPVFVAFETISLANAVVWWPGGTPNPNAPWYSTVAHVLIRTQLPGSWTEAMFQQAIAEIFPIMDAQVPAWATWDVYRPGPINANVSGGPSAAGFYLDDPHNLNLEVFDV